MDTDTEVNLPDDEEKPIEVVLEDEGGEATEGDRANTVPGAVVAPGKKRPRYKETVVRLKGENRSYQGIRLNC